MFGGDGWAFREWIFSRWIGAHKWILAGELDQIYDLNHRDTMAVTGSFCIGRDLQRTHALTTYGVGIILKSLMRSAQTIKFVALAVVLLATSAFAYPTVKLICEMRDMPSTTCPMHSGQPMGPKDCCEISSTVPQQNPIAIDSPVRVEFHAVAAFNHLSESRWTETVTKLSPRYFPSLSPPHSNLSSVILLL